MKTKYIFAVSIVALSLLGGGMVIGKTSGLFETRAPKNDALAVLATVDQQDITEVELGPLLQQGLSRETALDRRITQTVIAKAAESQFSEEANVLLRASRSDILNGLYLAKRSAVLRKEILPADVKAFYDKNVKDEDFRKVALKVFLTGDAREAQLMYEKVARAINANDGSLKKELEKMVYLKGDSENLNPLQELPYNMGQVIKKLKAGDVIAPVVIREGVMVVFIENFKDSPKPTLEKTSAEIIEILLQERLQKEIAGLRKLAAINLKQ